jgi:4-amino-4-deoxy-L-arabinose transferase-like glycosyltransferase
MSRTRANGPIWKPSTFPCKPSVLTKRDWLVAALLLLLSVYLYSHWIWRPISPDERNYLAWGFKVFKEGVYETVEGRPVVKVPPLHSYAMAAGFHLFGPSVDSAQAVSMVFGCLTVGLLYLYGASFWGWRVGLMAALLLLTAAKGEFWRYSNRVLNDIHLTFFVFLALYFLALFWRHGRWWTAAGAGISSGLGLLTKEFAALLLPVAVGAMVLGRWGTRKKGLSLLLAGSLLVIVLLPWILYVKGITGSLAGGTAQRAQGQALELLTSGGAWGLRSAREILDMVRFFDKPSWVIQVLHMASLVWGGWVWWKTKAGEVAIPLGMILIWYLVFAVFLALPLNLRRLIPLLPLYSLLSALLLDALRRRGEGLATRIGIGHRWTTVVFVVFFCVLLVANLKPSKVLRGFAPFSLFSSSMEPHYKKEIDAALGCIPAGASVLSNYPSLTYFYSQGAYRVRRLRTNIAERVLPWIGTGPKAPSGGPPSAVIYDFEDRGKRVFMDEGSFWEEVWRHDAEHLIFVRTGHRGLAPRALEEFMRRHEEVFAPLCLRENYSAYRIDRSALQKKVQGLRVTSHP